MEFTPPQRSSQCIRRTQPTGSLVAEEAYPSAEKWSVYSTDPADLIGDEFYPSAEKHSMYCTALADEAKQYLNTHPLFYLAYSYNIIKK